MNRLKLNRCIYLSLLISIGIFVAGCGSSTQVTHVQATIPVHVQPPVVKDTLHTVTPLPIVTIPPGHTVEYTNATPDTQLVVPDKPIVATHGRDTAKVDLKTGTVTTNIKPPPIDTVATLDTNVAVPPPPKPGLFTRIWNAIKGFFAWIGFLVILAVFVYIVIKYGLWQKVAVIAKIVGFVTKFI